MLYCYDKRDPQGAEELRWEDCTEEEKRAWADDLQARDVNRIMGAVKDLRRVLADQEQLREDYQLDGYGDRDHTRMMALDVIAIAAELVDAQPGSVTVADYKEVSLALLDSALVVARRRCALAELYTHVKDTWPLFGGQG